MPGSRRREDSFGTKEHVHKISLQEMLRLYQQKYSVKDIPHVLYGLTYFHDADKERVRRMLWDTDWRTVKRTIHRWVREVA